MNRVHPDKLEAIKVTAEKVDMIVVEAEADWAERGTVKPRNTLPLPVSAGCFKRLRQAACKYSGAQNCGCFRQGKWKLPQEGNPCETCNTPNMSSLEFSETLFGQELNKGGEYVGPAVSDRTIQRWLNAKSPAAPAYLIVAIGRAWRHGWISGSLAYTLAKDISAWEGILTFQRKKLAGKVAADLNGNFPLDGLVENHKRFYRAYGSSATLVPQCGI